MPGGTRRARRVLSNMVRMEHTLRAWERMEGRRGYVEDAEEYVVDGVCLESLAEYGGEGGWEEDAEEYVENGEYL